MVIHLSRCGSAGCGGGRRSPAKSRRQRPLWSCRPPSHGVLSWHLADEARVESIASTLDSKHLWKRYPILLDKALAIELTQYRAAAMQRLLTLTDQCGLTVHHP